MDLSNLDPAVENKVKEAADKTSEMMEETTKENIEIPLADDGGEKEFITKDGKKLTSKIITDKDEIAKIHAEKQTKKISNVIVDAATRTAAQMRLAACENDITIEAEYNSRLESLMQNEDLDKRGFQTAKMVLDGALKVASKMGVPDKDDTDTILLLAKTATGEFNPREEMAQAKVEVIQKSRVSQKKKEKRRKKNKMARKSRKRNK